MNGKQTIIDKIIRDAELKAESNVSAAKEKADAVIYISLIALLIRLKGVYSLVEYSQGKLALVGGDCTLLIQQRDAAPATEVETYALLALLISFLALMFISNAVKDAGEVAAAAESVSYIVSNIVG